MIYKPTDLSPSAQTFDVMDTPIFFECKVDTSNVQASGFTIEVLDSENNVVFSSIPNGKQLDIKYITIIDDLREYVHTYFADYESGYSLLNTGYNGSYLKFPFSVAKESVATNTAKINQIYYEKQTDGSSGSGLFYAGGYDENDNDRTGDAVKIYNGKEYKWSITLYQLENKGTLKNPVWILPDNPLMFDMPMTTGTVLGSNDKRIQSAYSEEIYGDYFIQPLKIDELNYTIGEEDSWTYSGSITQVGSRVAIKSYDMSFGYIYPVEGDNGFQTDTIKNGVSNAFRIYKNGNDPENLTAYQKVNFVANKALDKVTSTEWMINGRVLEDGTYGYNKGDIVLYNNNIYQCQLKYNPSDISHIPEKNDKYWSKIDYSINLWIDGKQLEYCKHNSSIYKRKDTTPNITPSSSDSEYWFEIKSFDSSKTYKIGNIVKYVSGETTTYYKCIKDTTASIEITNTEYWEAITQFTIEDFNSYKNYNINDGVRYSGAEYACIKKIDQTPVNGSAYWNLISYKNISYNENDIVGYVDKLYKCIEGYNVNDPIFNIEPSLYGYTQNPSIGDNKSMYWSIYNGQVWEWSESLANQGESYGTFTYYSLTDPKGVYTLPNDILPKTIIGGERIVLNNQLIGASYTNNNEYLGSPYNGIYTTSISSQYSYEEYNTSNTYKYGDMVLYEGSIYCCTGIVKDVEPGTSDNWNRYWIGTQSSNNAEDYDKDKQYKKDDVVQILTGKDENGNDIYSYYTCLGTVLGQTPSEGSIYWVKNERNGYRVTIRFNRAPDADSWGELMTKIVYVSGGNQFYGKNIQIKSPNEDGSIDTSDGYGIINQTPFKFIEEEPVEIYRYDYNENNPHRNTIGLIFYNKPIEDKENGNKNGILYARYFEGIQKGMMLQKLSNDNKYQYFIIEDVGMGTPEVGKNAGMYLKYSEVKEFDTYKPYTISDTIANANPITLTADTTWEIDETKYQIKTYFRESDENAFYFYSRPVVDIQFENTNGVNFVKNRTPLIDAYEWEEGRVYGKGDYVYIDTGDNEPYTRTYYLCEEDNTETKPQQSDAWTSLGTYSNGGGIRKYQEGIYYKKDTIVEHNDIFYISLTNITQLEGQPVKPEKENLGIFWEPYVGVLFREDIGFSYSAYNDLKVYNKGVVVYFEGKYYQVLKDIISKQPPIKYIENKEYNNNDIVWKFDVSNYNEWSIGTEYQENDLVFFNDKTTRYYKCKGNNIANENNNPESKNGKEFYWDVVYPNISYYIVEITGSGQEATTSLDSFTESDFENFIWNPYTNLQIKDESDEYIEYYNGNTVVYKGVTYECKTISEGPITAEGKEDDDFINTYWIRYTKLDGDEIFVDGIRYNKDYTIYNEFNPKNMYILDRVIYCDGVQYKVTSNETDIYDEATSYEYGDTVKYDVDNIGIYEYYIYISETPASGEPPIILNDGKKILNDDYWSSTVINTLPKITDDNYYGKYTSWSNKTLYNHGDIVLYNDVFYVYINENANRKSKYNSSINYKTGDLIRYETDGGAFEWKFYIEGGDPCYIVPEKDSSYPDDYVSTDFWIPYYGFMYYGDYNDGVSIGARYNYNNVVSFNGQYYIYVNPNINSYIDDVDSERLHNEDISLLKLSENQSDFKGDKKYVVGDIVMYNNKYYICYKDMEDWLYSPANTSYWTLFPWQIFISQIHERTIVCNGEYLQQQYIQWKSVQWFLCEEDGETILDKSEVIYDGDLTYTFHGVDGREKGSDKPVYFIIRLVIETRTGYRMTVDRKIEAIYEIEEIDSEGLISAYFDCDTMSVITEVTKESGFIMPTISEAGTIITYSEGENGEDGVMDLSGEVNYEKVLYSLESVSDIASAKDITSESERFELMGSHTINTDRFSGTVVSVSSSVANATTEETQEKGNFEIYLTQMLKNEGKINSYDTELSREDKIVLDDNRNVLQWRAKDVNGQVDFEGIVEVRNISGVGSDVIPQSDNPDSRNGDLGEFFDLDNFITCSNWQPKNFDYTEYKNTNYLPITYARYFEKNGEGIIEESGEHRNIKQSLNLYDDSAYEKSKIDKTTPCKRVQEPIISISNISSENNGDPNIFGTTAFNINPEVGSENSVGGITEVNIVGNIPTLCSDFAYKETYGVIEGMTGTNMYIRKKNVGQNFAYAHSDGKTYTKNTNGDIPELSEDVVWNNNMNMWSDGDFITTSKSTIYGIGKLRLNDEPIDIFKDEEYNGVPVDHTTPYSNSVLGYQEPISDDGDWNGENEIDIIPEREYLNGKTLIIDAELMMDGDGGITPYPNYEQPDKIVAYVNAPESAQTEN